MRCIYKSCISSSFKQASFEMYRYNIHTPLRQLFSFAVLLLVAKTDANRNQVTSTSDAGVCFYGKTAERVLSILATGKYRYMLPSVHSPRDCSDLDRKHVKSGVYKIFPEGRAGFQVYCDMETEEGGWTVFQRRQDGKTDFYRGWTDYAKGFGDVKTEFWLGNDKLHDLTSQGSYELRVDLQDFNDDKAYAKYSTFYIGDQSTNYILTVNGYSGTAGDDLKFHNKQAFSTKDKDNDSSGVNCAERYKGGWWYKSCHYTNLNGLYLGNKKSTTGMRWRQWKGNQSMKTTSMMIRRI